MSTMREWLADREATRRQKLQQAGEPTTTKPDLLGCRFMGRFQLWDDRLEIVTDLALYERRPSQPPPTGEPG